MGIISGIGNIYFVYQFIKKLVTPFEKTDAFKLGIIDKDGKILKKRRDLEGSKEKDAYTLSDTLVWNIKKLIGKVPGGKSKIASYAAALFLIKEQTGEYRIDDEELELQFFDQFEKTKLMCLSGVKQYPMRVKCATLSWHTMVSAFDEKTEEVKTEN